MSQSARRRPAPDRLTARSRAHPPRLAGGHTAAGAPGPVGGGLRGRTRPRDGPGRARAPADDHARPGGGVPGLLRPCRAPVLPVLAHLSGLRSSPRPGLGATGHPAVGSPRSVSRTTTAYHGLWRSLVAHLTGGQGVVGSNPASPTIVMSGDIVNG